MRHIRSLIIVVVRAHFNAQTQKIIYYVIGDVLVPLELRCAQDTAPSKSYFQKKNLSAAKRILRVLELKLSNRTQLR